MPKKLNAFMRARKAAAAKNGGKGAASFKYTNKEGKTNTYVKKVGKNGLLLYKKK
jgi:hypothetical protein